MSKSEQEPESERERIENSKEALYQALIAAQEVVTSEDFNSIGAKISRLGTESTMDNSSQENKNLNFEFHRELLGFYSFSVFP